MEDQIFWERGAFQACKSYPDGLSGLLQTVMDRDFRPATRNAFWGLIPRDYYPPCPENGRTTELRERMWHYYYYRPVWTNIVEDYMWCKLTKEEEKLVALSGVASLYSEMHGKEDFAAGLWKQELSAGLLRCTELRPETMYKVFRPETYHVPSWSWASLEGHILYGHGPFHDSDREMMSLNITLKTYNVFGQVSSASIILDKRIIEGYSLPHSHEDDEDLHIFGPRFQGICHVDEISKLSYDRKEGDHKF